MLYPCLYCCGDIIAVFIFGEGLALDAENSLFQARADQQLRWQNCKKSLSKMSLFDNCKVFPVKIKLILKYGIKFEWKSELSWLLSLLSKRQRAIQQILLKKVKIWSILWALSCTWCSAFVHVSDWVNNHAEKPYVQSVGCPTFGDDDERRNMSGLLGGGHV